MIVSISKSFLYGISSAIRIPVKDVLNTAVEPATALEANIFEDSEFEL
jgi:hypothetical protein